MTCLYLIVVIQVFVFHDNTWALSLSNNFTTVEPSLTTTNDDKLVNSTLPIQDNKSERISTTDNMKADYQLQQDLELLLDELRQVATAIHDVRSEHGQLAKNVAEMSVAVKDMSERNVHIRKKVRKMSKVLNKSTHHHKYKDGLRALQRDHQKILDAMASGNITLLSKNLTHLAHHHSKHQSNLSNEIISTESAEEKEVNKTIDPPVKKSGVEHKFHEKDIENSIDEENEILIPELVVEPPSGGGGGKIYPSDCTDVLNYGNKTSGTYFIQPHGLPKPIEVWCDQETEGGGWTVMVARMPISQQLNFSRNWNEYKYGFGNAASEYWIGNEALHLITSNQRNQLRVNITDWNDQEAWADWKEFKVDSESNYYRLTISRYSPSSTAGDALKWHNEMKFSTVDRDNDALMGGHCADTNMAGWWYRGHRGCYQAHPTGQFQKGPEEAPKKSKGRNFDIGPVLVWQNWRGESYYPKTLFMMFRNEIF